MASQTELEPTIFHAALRRPLLVVVGALLGVALGVGAAIALPSTPGFVATASLILQEPNSDETASNSPRFLANQVEVMSSTLVAEEAARLISENEQGPEVSAAEILENVGVFGGSASDLVLITAEAETSERALAMVNGVIQAYENISEIGATSTAQAALERIDDQLDSLESRLETVQLQIEQIKAEDVLASTLADQAQQALAQVADLQAQLVNADGDELEQIRSELNVLRDQLALYQLINTVDQGPPELVAAEEEESQLITRRADLLRRRDQLLIELDSTPSPILLAVPASEASPIPPPGPARFAIGGLILGALAGIGIAYWLVVRRRVFSSRTEPESILGAPLIAEVADFAGEGIDSELPVRDYPRTVVAEAYRFAAASLELKAADASAQSIMAVSAVVGNGKTTTVANAVLALAGEGRRVLAIDADLGNQALARLLGGGDAPLHPGLSDVLGNELPIDLALQDIQIGEAQFSLIGRGRAPGTAADLFRQPSSQAFFRTVREQFDLVIVDAPPLLQVAYSSTLLRYLDSGLVIVGHESAVGELEEVADRMAFLGVPAIGYIYNMAPLRKDLPRSGGSLMDILGSQGVVPDEPRPKDRGSRNRTDY